MNIIELRNLFNNTFGMYVKGTNTKSINLPMETLVENINVVQSREQLLKEVWGFDSEVETNVVDVYIRYLRNKIDDPESKASYIQTVRGTGYVMRS